MPIRSLDLGLSGRADVVEFHLLESGQWQPYPVEYKRGRPKKDNSDKVQLCAQAICMEEMFEIEVPEGALYCGKKKRRTPAQFDSRLRNITAETAKRLHVLIENSITPPPHYSKRCDNCSLVDLCLPETTDRKRKVGDYIRQMLKETP